MGDRGNILVRDGSQPGVYLYTHFSGSDLPGILRAALKRAKSRWDDAQYLARIIFQEMLGGDDGEVGFGIAAYFTDGNHPTLVVDTDAGTVTWEPMPDRARPAGPATVLTIPQYLAVEGDEYSDAFPELRQ